MKPRLIPDSLAGRMAVILICGIVFLHAIGLGSYDLDRVAVLGDAGLDRMAERVASSVRLAERAAVADRPAIVESMSNNSVAVSWSNNPLVTTTDDDEASREFADELSDWLSLSKDRVHVVQSTDGGALASVRLDDGSWIDAKAAPFVGDEGDLRTLIVSTSGAALGILVFSLLMVRWVTLPLRRLSDAADRLGMKLDSVPMAEAGPAEVRSAAAAFNRMQSRIHRFVNDRTQMFAAISHDLKTPITRLKLRAEFMDDEAERLRMMRDLDDMEQMVVSLLSFLRDENDVEQTRLADLTAIIRTICDSFTDAGHLVSVESVPPACTLSCRAGAVKRAISNIVDNAVKYGGSASVNMYEIANAVVIDVTDTGPGIPEAELERVFAPFQRLETSRNRDTGGTGLGLTIARTIVRAHGGELTLTNRVSSGCLVSITLPRPEKSVPEQG